MCAFSHNKKNSFSNKCSLYQWSLKSTLLLVSVASGKVTTSPATFRLRADVQPANGLFVIAVPVPLVCYAAFSAGTTRKNRKRFVMMELRQKFRDFLQDWYEDEKEEVGEETAKKALELAKQYGKFEKIGYSAWDYKCTVSNTCCEGIYEVEWVDFADFTCISFDSWKGDYFEVYFETDKLDPIPHDTEDTIYAANLYDGFQPKHFQAHVYTRGAFTGWNWVVYEKPRNTVLRALGPARLLLHSDFLTLSLKGDIIDKLLETPQVLSEVQRSKFIYFLENCQCHSHLAFLDYVL